jgi:hypothetical protein
MATFIELQAWSLEREDGRVKMRGWQGKATKRLKEEVRNHEPADSGRVGPRKVRRMKEEPAKG